MRVRVFLCVHGVIMAAVAVAPPVVDIEDPEFRRQLRKNYRELQQESTSACCPRRYKKHAKHHPPRLFFPPFRTLPPTTVPSSVAGEKDVLVAPESGALEEMLVKADALAKNGACV